MLSPDWVETGFTRTADVDPTKNTRENDTNQKHEGVRGKLNGRGIERGGMACDKRPSYMKMCKQEWKACFIFSGPIGNNWFDNHYHIFLVRR